MDRLGQVKGEEHKREAEGRKPSPHPLQAQALCRPFAGRKEGRRGMVGGGGDLTRNPQPADGGERELTQLFVRLGGREEEGGVCMALGSRACPCCSPPLQLFPDHGVGRPLPWRHAPLLTPLILSALPPSASASHQPLGTDSNLAPTWPLVSSMPNTHSPRAHLGTAPATRTSGPLSPPPAGRGFLVRSPAPHLTPWAQEVRAQLLALERVLHRNVQKPGRGSRTGVCRDRAPAWIPTHSQALSWKKAVGGCGEVPGLREARRSQIVGGRGF